MNPNEYDPRTNHEHDTPKNISVTLRIVAVVGTAIVLSLLALCVWWFTR